MHNISLIDLDRSIFLMVIFYEDLYLVLGTEPKIVDSLYVARYRIILLGDGKLILLYQNFLELIILVQYLVQILFVEEHLFLLPLLI